MATYRVVEMKGVAGVDEKEVAGEDVDAVSEDDALERARSYYGMLAAEDEIRNGSGRYNHYLMVDGVVCAYCGMICAHDGEVVPAVDDDAEWEFYSQDHHEDCEWIKTRAHRLPMQEEVG